MTWTYSPRRQGARTMVVSHGVGLEQSVPAVRGTVRPWSAKRRDEFPIAKVSFLGHG